MKYSSNINQVAAELRAQFEKEKKNLSAVQREIATSIRASNLRRIHNDGLDENDTPIGHYNTSTPLYVSPAKSPRKFPAKGKKGNTTFKSGKTHKTGYFASYSAFRSTVGREVAFVNLQLSGRLMRSWNLSQSGNDYVVGFTNDYGAKISSGMEEKYGKIIWGVSASDEKLIDAVILRYAQKNNNA